MRHEYLSVYQLENDTINSNTINVDEINVGGGGYLMASHNFAADGKTSGSTYAMFDITGDVRVRVLPVVRTNLVSKAGNTDSKLHLYAGDTHLLTTTTCADLDAGECWVTCAAAGILKCIATSAILDRVIAGEDDISIMIESESMTTGILDIHLWWEPISDGAAVTVA